MFTRRSAFFSELPRAKRTMKHRHFAKFVALVVVGFVSCRESPRTAATQGATAAPQQFRRSDQLLFAAARIGLPPDRKRVVQGKSGDLGGCRIILKKKP